MRDGREIHHCLVQAFRTPTGEDPLRPPRQYDAREEPAPPGVVQSRWIDPDGSAE
jgi:hypothetical protein